MIILRVDMMIIFMDLFMQWFMWIIWELVKYWYRNISNSILSETGPSVVFPVHLSSFRTGGLTQFGSLLHVWGWSESCSLFVGLQACKPSSDPWWGLNRSRWDLSGLLSVCCCVYWHWSTNQLRVLIKRGFVPSQGKCWCIKDWNISLMWPRSGFGLRMVMLVHQLQTQSW